MRLSVVVFSMFLMWCFPLAVAGQEMSGQPDSVRTRYEKMMTRRMEMWQRLIPDHYKMQFAGSIGMVSAGTGLFRRLFFRIRLAEFEVDVVARFDLHDVEPDHFAGLDHAPVPAGGVADLALEQSGEIVLVGEVEVGGDLLDRPAGAVKQLLHTASFRFSRYW